MKIALAEEMRQIDKNAVEEGLMPSILLMENAGYALANEALAMLGNRPEGRNISIFAGCGNNGGDAFVAARYLMNFGAKVRVFLLADEEKLTKDALTMYNILKTMQGDIQFLKDEKSWDKVSLYMLLTDLIIDGILGTGFYGSLDGDYKRAVIVINESRKPVLSIDIPSGVNADSGQVENIAVAASHTVTLALPKMGLFLFPGKSYSGKVSVASIGIPENIIATAKIGQNLITSDMVSLLLPRRSMVAHKNQMRTAVIAGAKSTIGAAALCSEAALRAGSGVVKLFTSSDIFDIMSVKMTEVMVESLCCADDIGLDPEFVDHLTNSVADFDVLAVGPGLGQKAGTAETVCHLIKETDRKLVLDADALNIIASKPELLKSAKHIPVLTPHLGEMARLTGLTIDEIKKEGVVRIARRFAIEWNAVVVLKGMPTVVALPEGEVFVNTNGNPGMATAGSGDVLAGIIASFIAQGLEQSAAAVSGVHVHSFAADLIAENGVIGFAAGDIIAALPRALLELSQYKGVVE